MKPYALVSGLMALSLCGCSMAPHYVRPDAPVASQWSVPASDPIATDSATPFGWRDVFTDQALVKTIERTLANNRDMRVAALNVEKAHATYGIQRAASWPTINANMAASQSKSLSATNTTSTNELYSTTLGLSAFEIDLFGRIRSQNQASLNAFYASLDTRRAITQILIAQTATAWLTLGADLDALILAQRTVKTRFEALEIAQKRAQIGVLSDLDLAAIESLAQTARADLAKAQTLVDQDKAALTLLVGAPLDDALMPKTLSRTQVAQTIPVGLPSSLLLNRPDIRAAEHNLMSAQANIGAARAAFFPRISLTGSKGLASRDLDGLFGAGLGIYSFSPQISVPIFSGGANLLGLKTAKLNRDIALATYEKSIQTAFAEVNQALAVRALIDERLDAQTKATKAAQTAYDLALARYQIGTDSYLVLLEATRTLNGAEQNLLGLKALKANNLVALYKALGHDDSLPVGR